jgi:ribosome-associated protein
VTRIIQIGEEYITFKASRAGGPGGQRVNRRSTKIQAWVKIGLLPYTEKDKKLIREKLANRINQDDELIVENEEERTQIYNKENAIQKINELIAGALKKNPPRIPTKPSRGAKEERLNHKRLRYQKKQSRREDGASKVEE